MADDLDISGFASALKASSKNTTSSVDSANVGNLRPVGSSTGFQKFDTPEAGIKAMDEQLKIYGEKHKINTLRGLINRYAPPSDNNNTESYIKFVSDKTGFKPDQEINLSDPVIRHIISGPMIIQEKGLNNLLGNKSKVTVETAPDNSQFDISGFKNALSGETELTKEAIKKETKPAIKEPENPEADVEAEVGKIASNIPGVKSAQSFMMGLGKNAVDTVSAIQQLGGKAVGFVAPETGENISQSAKEKAKLAEQINKPYMEENPVANIAGNVTGAVFNPVNKVVPFAAPTTLLGGLFKGAIQGAANMGLTTPVMNEEKSFAGEKLRQMTFGAAGGAAGGAAFHLASGVGSYIGKNLEDAVNAIRSKIGPIATTENLSKATDDVLKNVGVDAQKVAPDILAGLKEQAALSLKTGDVSNLKRFSDAMSLPVPVPMLRGQVTRDPMQYAIEQNLSGVVGVGEPITNVLSAQNKALIANLDKIGANGSRNVVESGQSLFNTLKNADTAEQAQVREAYKAFKNSTGKDLQVPLTGLAQDYAKVNKDFGDVIPSPIKTKFEALGLMSGKPTKTFSIEDAEQLIKDINLRYDPLNKPQTVAFNQLNNAIENAIENSGQGLSGEAAKLAKNAREAASKRFTTIRQTPALQDMVRNVEPDKFLQKHILQGKVNEIQSLKNYLLKNNPEELAQLQSDIVGVIKAKVLNGVSPENATFSQAQLKSFLSNENAPKLSRILTKDQMGALRQLNRTAENALYKPAASAVNTSKTASAQANINNAIKGGTINEILGITQGIPGLSSASEYLARKNQSRLASGLIEKATNPLAPETAGVPRNLIAKPGIASSTALRELINYRNREQQ